MKKTSICLFFLMMLSSIVKDKIKLSESTASKLIENAKNESYIVSIPTGQIQILNPMEEEYGDKQYPDKTYRSNMLKFLQVAEKIGLLSLREVKQRGIDVVSMIKYRIFNVTLTEKGKNAIVKKRNSGSPQIILGQMKMRKIVKITDWRHPNPSKQYENYKLILGVFDFFPSDIGKELLPAQGYEVQSQYKIKALLKEDPFKEEWKYVTSDWGYLNKEVFESNKIP